MKAFILSIIYIAFISLGLPDSMLGAAWPAIRATLLLPVSAAGLISMLTFGGTIVSSVLSGILIDRMGTEKLTLLSVFMTALALLGFSFGGGYWWMCVMAIPLGLGGGAVDAALNNFVALHFSARHMSWLHCFWGIGATIGPVIMSFAIAQANSWQMGYFIVAMVQLGLVVVLFTSLPMWKSYGNMARKNVVDAQKTNSHVLRLPGIRPCLLSFFCYCALEAAVGLWGASYAVQVKGVATEVAARWISLYYLGITLGRLINGFAALKFSNAALIRAGEITTGLGVVFLFAASPVLINLIGFILIGLGCAPIYPSMLHETPARFGKGNSSKLMGLEMAAAYLGSMFVPPILGLLWGVIGIHYCPVVIMLILVVMAISNEQVNIVVKRRGMTMA